MDTTSSGGGGGRGGGRGMRPRDRGEGWCDWRGVARDRTAGEATAFEEGGIGADIGGREPFICHPAVTVRVEID